MANDTTSMKAKPPAEPRRALVLDHRTGVVSSNPLPEGPRPSVILGAQRQAAVDQPARDIFVFGSNTAGRHGKGAALFAMQNHGAVYGQGEGLQGDSYAIPTKSGGKRGPLTRMAVADIGLAVDRFLVCATLNPQLTFKLTKIGCGLAGFMEEQIAPLFVGAPANVVFPYDFVSVLDWKARFAAGRAHEHDLVAHRASDAAAALAAMAKAKPHRDHEQAIRVTLLDRRWHKDEG